MYVKSMITIFPSCLPAARLVSDLCHVSEVRKTLVVAAGRPSPRIVLLHVETHRCWTCKQGVRIWRAPAVAVLTAMRNRPAQEEDAGQRLVPPGAL